MVVSQNTPRRTDESYIAPSKNLYLANRLQETPRINCIYYWRELPSVEESITRKSWFR